MEFREKIVEKIIEPLSSCCYAFIKYESARSLEVESVITTPVCVKCDQICSFFFTATSYANIQYKKGKFTFGISMEEEDVNA